MSFDDMPPEESPDWQDQAPSMPVSGPEKGQVPPAAEPEQCLPDGFGLSVEDVRALLAKKHDAAIPKDDPLLMVVTILNAFLEKQIQLQKKHENALGAFMGEQTAAYVADMEESMAGLTKTLSGVTIEGIGQAASGFAASLAGHKSTLYLCTAIMGLSALLNVAVFILR